MSSFTCGSVVFWSESKSFGVVFILIFSLLLYDEIYFVVWGVSRGFNFIIVEACVSLINFKPIFLKGRVFFLHV